MGERVFVAGFVITREEWEALGEDGQEQILAAQTSPHLPPGTPRVIPIAEGTGQTVIAAPTAVLSD